MDMEKVLGPGVGLEAWVLANIPDRKWMW